uniref:Uncharacterized protein n=1 Tax=Glossina palpalis gambiensis TaxID=67801 RepID=A0A1B0BA57_9MUSC
MLQLLLAYIGYYRDPIPYVFLVAFVIFYIYQLRLHKAHISSKEFALKKTQKGLKGTCTFALNLDKNFRVWNFIDLIVKKRYNERKYQKAVEEKKMDIHFLKLRIKKYEQEIKIFQIKNTKVALGIAAKAKNTLKEKGEHCLYKIRTPTHKIRKPKNTKARLYLWL